MFCGFIHEDRAQVDALKSSVYVAHGRIQTASDLYGHEYRGLPVASSASAFFAAWFGAGQ